MENYKVKAIEINSSKEIDMEIEADESEANGKIILTAYLNKTIVQADDYYYFSAFQKLRDKNLEIGYGIKCCGAQINAVQSEMMSASEKIYLVTPGLQASMSDIACIYDFEDINVFPNTAEQTAFCQKWICSV